MSSFAWKFFCVAITLFGIGISQSKLELIKQQHSEVIYYAPKKEHLSFTTFGFRSVMADWLWLKSGSYFINQIGKNGDYKFLGGMYETCIELDPKFKQVYRDVMSFMLSDEKNYLDVERLLLKGRDSLEDDWELNYMLGMLYAFYLKDKNKSLQAFEKAWELIPETEEFIGQKNKIQIAINSITKDFNKGFELVRYWLQKIDLRKGKDSNEFVLGQIRYYFSKFLAEELNKIFAQDESERIELLRKKRGEIFGLMHEYQLIELLGLNKDKIFSSVDASGYEWLFDKSTKKFFSYGAGAYELKRKLINFQYGLMGYLQEYREPVDFNYVNIPHEEWYLHFKKKKSVSEYPPEEVIFDFKALPKLNSPMMPKYDRKYGVFSMPTYSEVKEKFQ